MKIKYWLVIFLSLALSQAFAQEEGQDNAQQTSAQDDVQTAEKAEAEAEAPKEEASTPSSGRVEKLEVTGSHIKRIDVEGPSPVLTLDRDYLDRTGFNNVGDVLRETTVASFGGDRENALSGGALTGASTTSLRGFGSERILVLMDGRRLPTIGGTSSVDLALIPMAAVERIEILKDGASAIYGSDALGGVINVITKKDLDGATVEMGVAVPESPGGTRTDVKASYGKTFSKGSILGVLQYRSNQETWSRDYDFAVPTKDWFSTFGSPGTWYNPVVPPPTDPSAPKSVATPASDCPPELRVLANPNNPAAGMVCAFDYSPYSQLTPLIDQYSALLNGDYKINEDLKLFASGVYTHRDVQNQLAPPPDRFRNDAPGPDTRIPQATATAWGLSGVNGDLPELRYRPVEEAGPRRGRVKSDSFNVNTGIQGYIGDTWDWEFSGTHGASFTENVGVSGYANKFILHEMAVNDPASFNPFLPSGSKSDISSALYQPVDGINSSMSTVNLKASGEIAEMPAGPLGIAVGVSNAWQTFEQTSDAVTAAGRQWGGGVSATGTGLRDFQSFYSELAIPILTNLEAQVAGRFDNYSDFGSTFNPKFGLRYKPVTQLMLRGSWGTGFRAPNLEDLYRGELRTFPIGNDPISGQRTQFEEISSGNRNLREETTESLNVGFVWQILQELSFTADYWRTKQNNAITRATNRQIFLAEDAFGNDYLKSFGIDVQRSCETCTIDRIINPSINLASVDVSGLDLGVGFILPFNNGYRLRLNVDHSILFQYLNEIFPGMPIEDRVGFFGIPHWRNTVNLGYGNQIYDFGLVARTIGETNASALSPTPGVGGKTRDHTELDLRTQVNLNWGGSVSFLVRNILNTNRPLYDEHLPEFSGFLDTAIYDPFGRTYMLNYRQDF